MRLALKIGHVYRFYNQPTAKFHTEVTLPAEHSLEKLAKLFDSLLSTAIQNLTTEHFPYVFPYLEQILESGYSLITFIR